jgi:hypothetical protein
MRADGEKTRYVSLIILVLFDADIFVALIGFATGSEFKPA